MSYSIELKEEALADIKSAYDFYEETVEGLGE